MSQHEWYRDATDPRCPHDGWLQHFEMKIEGGDGDEDQCVRTIRIVLLAAYHNGTITIHYRHVAGYDVMLRDPRSPGKIARRRDWLSDTVESLPDGTTKHIIEWEDAVWTIESREAEYEWTPSNPSVMPDVQS